MPGIAAFNKFPASASVALGSPAVVSLPNSNSIQVPAWTLTATLETQTAGSEDSSVTFNLLRGGAPTDVVKFNAKLSAGNYPVEIKTRNSGITALAFTDTGGDGEIVNTTTNRNFGYGTTGTGATYTYSQGVFGLICQSDGTICDAGLGGNIALANAATLGYAHMPTCTTTGAQTGAPARTTGFWANRAPFLFNTADNKLWIRNVPSAAWKSIQLI